MNTTYPLLEQPIYKITSCSGTKFKINVMYVKQFDEKGNVTNPITKTNPFVNKQPKQRYQKQRKKAKLIITQIGRTFYKYRAHLQNINGKTIEHLSLISSGSIGLK